MLNCRSHHSRRKLAHTTWVVWETRPKSWLKGCNVVFFIFRSKASGPHLTFYALSHSTRLSKWCKLHAQKRRMPWCIKRVVQPFTFVSITSEARTKQLILKFFCFICWHFLMNYGGKINWNSKHIWTRLSLEINLKRALAGKSIAEELNVPGNNNGFLYCFFSERLPISLENSDWPICYTTAYAFGSAAEFEKTNGQRNFRANI